MEESQSVIAANSGDSLPATAATRKALEAGAAQAVGWAGLAVINQVLLLALPKSGAGGGAVRLAHHAYDAGQLLAAGFVSWGLVELAGHAGRRLGAAPEARWPRAVALGLACLVVTLLVVKPDVSNAAARYELPVWAACWAAALSFGAMLAATPFLAHVRARWVRGLCLLIGLTGAAGNAFVLLNDYPAAHLMLAWLSAALIAVAVEGLLPNPKLPRRLALAALGTTALLSFTTVLWRPSQSVLKRLYGLPSSALAPLLARLYRGDSEVPLELVRREYLASPWFRARAELPPSAPSRALALPNPKLLLLLTVDATRADVLRDPKELRSLPAFAALRERCANFTMARSTASSTRATMSTLFLGQHLVQFRSSMKELHYHGPRLPVLLTAANVHTVSLPRYSRIKRAAGVTEGFQVEIPDFVDAAGLRERLLAALEPDKPGFYFTHFVEPHAPYKGKGKPFQRYLQEVRRVDKELVRIFDTLKERGLEERALVIVSSDHGEAFGEHGANYHQRVIYEEVARVPLFICGPGVVAREIDEPVSLIDLAPTILDAFGLPSPGVWMGQSLLPLAAGGNDQLQRPIVIEATHGLQGFYFRDGKKVLFDTAGKTTEVYDLTADPEERQNLADSRESSVRSAVATAKYFFRQHELVRDREYPLNQAPVAEDEGGMEGIDE